MNVACSALISEVQKVALSQVCKASDCLAACEFRIFQLLSCYGVAGYGDAACSMDSVGKSGAVKTEPGRAGPQVWQPQKPLRRLYQLLACRLRDGGLAAVR